MFVKYVLWPKVMYIVCIYIYIYMFVLCRSMYIEYHSRWLTWFILIQYDTKDVPNLRKWLINLLFCLPSIGHDMFNKPRHQRQLRPRPCTPQIDLISPATGETSSIYPLSLHNAEIGGSNPTEASFCFHSLSNLCWFKLTLPQAPGANRTICGCLDENPVSALRMLWSGFRLRARHVPLRLEIEGF